MGPCSRNGAADSKRSRCISALARAVSETSLADGTVLVRRAPPSMAPLGGCGLRRLRIRASTHPPTCAKPLHCPSRHNRLEPAHTRQREDPCHVRLQVNSSGGIPHPLLATHTSSLKESSMMRFLSLIKPTHHPPSSVATTTHDDAESPRRCPHSAPPCVVIVDSTRSHEPIAYERASEKRPRVRKSRTSLARRLC